MHSLPSKGMAVFGMQKLPIGPQPPPVVAL
jgi:hypothetical protein